MNNLKMWLMNKYCPEFYYRVPYYENSDMYVISVLSISGTLGQRVNTLKQENVIGIKNAYYTVRWYALKYDMLTRLFSDSGIVWKIEKRLDIE